MQFHPAPSVKIYLFKVYSVHMQCNIVLWSRISESSRTYDSRCSSQEACTLCENCNKKGEGSEDGGRGPACPGSSISCSVCLPSGVTDHRDQGHFRKRQIASWFWYMQGCVMPPNGDLGWPSPYLGVCTVSCRSPTAEADGQHVLGAAIEPLL